MLANDNALETGKELNREAAGQRTRDRQVYTPRVDILEKQDGLELLVELPGADEGSVNVTLEKNVLKIEAQVDAPDYGACKPAHIEYGVGDFSRSFTLSEEIDRDGIQASMKDGLLHLSLPKAEPAKTRKIAIQSN